LSSLYAPDEQPTLPYCDGAARAERAERLRILGGRWKVDLDRAIARHFSVERYEAALPVMARNLAKNVVSQLAQLYRRPPDVMAEGASQDALDDFLADVADGGVWSQGRRHQREVLFVREGWRSVGVVGDEGDRRLMWRRPKSTHVSAVAPQDDPTVPYLVVEAQPRTWVSMGKAHSGLTWDVYDLRDPEEPRHVVLDAREAAGDDKELYDLPNITEAVHGPGANFSGAAYPFRYADGEPFIPYVLYHAEDSGVVYDSWEGVELKDATLTVAVLWSFWVHVVKDASWAQRATLNMSLGSARTIEGPGGVNYQAVTADPASIMQFRGEAGLPPSFHQWQPAADPERLEMAVSSFERATAATFGLSGEDLTRTTAASSGYALTISRGAIREKQREYALGFGRADAELLAKSAALANAEGMYSAALPDDVAAWTVSYPAIPPSEDERKAGAEKIKAYKDAGLEPSEVWTVQQIEQVGREEAERILMQWAEDRDQHRGVELREGLEAAVALLGEDASPEVLALLADAMGRVG
jgi:hypothetical protein